MISILIKWKEEAKELIQKIIEESAIEEKDEKGKVVKKVPNSVKLTTGQKDRIEAIERSLSKFAFDTGIRILYMAPKDIFDKGNGGGLTGSLKQFNTAHLNGFKPSDGMSFDYKWQDWSGKKLLGKKIGHLMHTVRADIFIIQLRQNGPCLIQKSWQPYIISLVQL